jgi:hypothetical protein
VVEEGTTEVLRRNKWLSDVSGSRWIRCVKCKPSTNALPAMPVLIIRTPRTDVSRKTGQLTRTGEKRNAHKSLVENTLRGREHTGNQAAYESIKVQWK